VGKKVSLAAFCLEARKPFAEKMAFAEFLPHTFIPHLTGFPACIAFPAFATSIDAFKVDKTSDSQCDQR